MRFPDIADKPQTMETLRQARQAFERSYIQMALKDHDWNITKTAETLGIERSHLYRKMEQLGIRGE